MERRSLPGLTVLAFVVVALLGLLVSGCSEDCPTCPKPPTETRYDGRLYVTSPYWWDSTGGLFVIDTQTDSILDSIVYPAGVELALPAVSGDGKYLAARMLSGSAVVYDAATLEVCATLDASYPCFAKSNTALLGTRPGGVVVKYNVPGFGLAGSVEFARAERRQYPLQRVHEHHLRYRVDRLGHVYAHRTDRHRL